MLVSTIIAALSVLSISAAQKVSSDGKCGNIRGKQVTCLKSTFGSCCSQYGWCGSSAPYCKTGCQTAFGSCGSASSSSILPTTLSTSARGSSTPAAQPVSTNARCGADFGGKTCLGSKWGNCCSKYNYCGSTSDYCAIAKCQTGYGLCQSISSSIARPSTATSALLSSSSTSYATSSPSSAVASSVQTSSPISSSTTVGSTSVVSSTTSPETSALPSPSSTSVSSGTSLSEVLTTSSSSPTLSTVPATPSPSKVCVSQILTNGDFETGSFSSWDTYSPVIGSTARFDVVTEDTTSNHVYQFSSNQGSAGHIRQSVNLPSEQVTISCSFRYRIASGTVNSLFEIYAQAGNSNTRCATSKTQSIDWLTVTGTLDPIMGSSSTAYLWVNYGSDTSPKIYIDDFVVSYCYQPS